MICRFLTFFKKSFVSSSDNYFYSSIDSPFELLKQGINNTFANLTFDPTLLPVPYQNRLSFCNELDTSVVNDIGHDLIKTTEIGAYCPRSPHWAQLSLCLVQVAMHEENFRKNP